jgi:hypothetical protein
LSLAPPTATANPTTYQRSCDDWFQNNNLSRNGRKRYQINWQGLGHDQAYGYISVGDPQSYDCRVTETIQSDGSAKDTVRIFSNQLPVTVTQLPPCDSFGNCPPGIPVGTGTADVMNTVEFINPNGPGGTIPFWGQTFLLRIQTVSDGVLTATGQAGFNAGDQIAMHVNAVLTPPELAAQGPWPSPNADDHALGAPLYGVISLTKVQ